MSTQHKNLVFTLFLLIMAVNTYAKQLPPAYDESVPYYVKYCISGQYNSKKEKGTPYGHAFFYIKGTKIVSKNGKDYLEMLDDDADLSNPNAGTGLSTDSQLKNTPFILTPGLNTLLYGGLSPDQPLTKEVEEQVINRSIYNYKLFKNIQFTKESLKDIDPNDHIKYMAKSSLGTNYALTLARNVYCINIPTTRKEIKLGVDEVNKQIKKPQYYAEYTPTGKFTSIKRNSSDFIYDITDHCGVIAYNIFAKIFSFKTVWNNHKHAYLAISYAQTPIDLMERIFNQFGNPKNTKGFRPGTLAEFIPIHKFKNELYNDSPIIYDSWNGTPIVENYIHTIRRYFGWNSKKQKLENLIKDPRFSYVEKDHFNEHCQVARQVLNTSIGNQDLLYERPYSNLCQVY